MLFYKCLNIELDTFPRHNDSFDTCSPFDNLKASFHCTHFSKKFQILTAVYNSMFKFNSEVSSLYF